MSNTPFFSKLFGPSPIAPIQDHMKLCEQCAEELLPFIEAVVESDWQTVRKQYDKIDELESEADEVKRKIRMNLPRSLFLPFSRNNLLDLLQVQDRIANTANDIAGLIVGREMKFPEDTHDLLRKYTAASVDAVRHAKEAMEELDELIQTGFSGQEVEFVANILDKLHEAESESDKHQIEIRRSVFHHEADLNPIEVMFLYQIINLIGDIADDAETVGNRMMYLIAG